MRQVLGNAMLPEAWSRFCLRGSMAKWGEFVEPWYVIFMPRVRPWAQQPKAKPLFVSRRGDVRCDAE